MSSAVFVLPIQHPRTGRGGGSLLRACEDKAHLPSLKALVTFIERIRKVQAQSQVASQAVPMLSAS